MEFGGSEAQGHRIVLHWALTYVLMVNAKVLARIGRGELLGTPLILALSLLMDLDLGLDFLLLLI